MKKYIRIFFPILLVMLLSLISTQPDTQLPERIKPDSFIGTLTHALFLYLIWHIIWFIRKLFNMNKRAGGIVMAAVFLLVICAGVIILLGQEADNSLFLVLVRFAVVAALFLTIQIALEANFRISQLKLEKQEILSENLRVQMESLRTKVDPHFLFNTLNTLRVMVRNGNRESEAFVMNFSEFYRKTLQLSETPTMTLSQEMEVVKSYLFLMEKRHEHALELSFDIGEDAGAGSLPAMALQTVTENCFKHNTLTEARPLHISVTSEGNHTLVIRNNKQLKLTREESLNHGLKNLSKRYDLLGITGGVQVQDSSRQFEVRLKLLEP